jgi:hypothetical protein
MKQETNWKLFREIHLGNQKKREREREREEGTTINYFE